MQTHIKSIKYHIIDALARQHLLPHHPLSKRYYLESLLLLVVPVKWCFNWLSFKNFPNSRLYKTITDTFTAHITCMLAMTETFINSLPLAHLPIALKNKILHYQPRITSFAEYTLTSLHFAALSAPARNLWSNHKSALRRSPSVLLLFSLPCFLQGNMVPATSWGTQIFAK